MNVSEVVSLDGPSFPEHHDAVIPLIGDIDIPGLLVDINIERVEEFFESRAN